MFFYDKAEFQEAPASEVRNLMFTKSLALEKYMSMFLAEILDVEDHLMTKSFGNTSSALTFNHKLNLFADLGYIEKNDKTRLHVFAEIRNLFAHNFECVTFSDAFTAQIRNTLKKYYPILPKEDPSEKDYQKVFDLLFEDIKTIFKSLREKIYNNKINDFIEQWHRYALNEIIENIKKHPADFNIEMLDIITKKIFKLSSEKYGFDVETFREDIALDIGRRLIEPRDNQE